MEFTFDRLKDIVGKGENAGYQHVLLVKQWFWMVTFSGSFKLGIKW